MEINSIDKKEALVKTNTKSPNNNNDFSAVFKKELSTTKNHNQSLKNQESDKTILNQPDVFLGTLSKSMPTVSNILIKDPVYGKNCWSIVHSKINHNKPYKKICAGTKIYMNPSTKELLWGKITAEQKKLSVPEIKNKEVLSEQTSSQQASDKTISIKLVNAVKPYIGKNYDEINCYELIVKGLKKMGIKYHGSEGLKHQLIKMASEKGLHANAYLNGEGLIKSCGSTVYYKSLIDINDPNGQGISIINELKPVLEKGLILSFSTPTKGHTGIVSQSNDKWTFINSGKMDHNIIDNKDNVKGVGEENLIEEIINWLKRAKDHNENLKISAGKLNKDKLSVYNNPISQKSSRAG